MFPIQSVAAKAVVLLLVTATGLAAQDQNVTIKGSDTMLVMNQQLAQEYMKEFPGTNIQVSGGGSGVGIAALRDNTTDIAAASRLIKPKEVQDFLVNVGSEPSRFSAALDGIAIFVNTGNPIQELTIDQLGKIFHGDYTNWNQLGGPDEEIDVYSRENTSGTYSYVKDEVLKGADYTTRAQTLPGTAAVYDAVSKDPKGIGYGGIGYNKGVKLVSIKSDPSSPSWLPTEENVESQVYPLSRSLNYYLNPRTTNQQAMKFIQWVASPAGQDVVVKSGYFGLPKVVAKADEKTTAPDSTSAPPPPPARPVAANPSQTSTKPTSGETASSPATAPAVIAPTALMPDPQLEPPAPPPLSLSEREARVLVREEAVALREAKVAEREEKLEAELAFLKTTKSK